MYPVKNIRDIRISSASNGYVVQVGCTTLLFTDMEAFLRELRAYLTDPNRAEKTFLENFNMPVEAPSVTLGSMGYSGEALAKEAIESRSRMDRGQAEARHLDIHTDAPRRR